MEEPRIIIYENSTRQACSDRALVLLSVGIPHAILPTDNDRFQLSVPESFAERAKYELWEYERENIESRAPVRSLTPNYGGAIPGVIFYVLIVAMVAWMSARATFGVDWLAAGRIDGALIREGEWWRVVTALSLHGGLKHLLGNIVFGALFGILAGGLVGPGVVWLSILVAAGLANTLNIFLLDAAHRSIGASTAVFAALGIVSGFVWRGKLMAQERWAWRLGPVVGGLALLAYTGTGDANTDVGAHLAGFVCGFGAGVILSKLPESMKRPGVQWITGTAAIIMVCVTWAIALHYRS